MEFVHNSTSDYVNFPHLEGCDYKSLYYIVDYYEANALATPIPQYLAWSRS